MSFQINFLKKKWFQNIPFILSKQPTLEDLKPTFVGYLKVEKFYHRDHRTKIGHMVITPQGLGEIIEIIPPDKSPTLKWYQYQVKLLDNVLGFFDENLLKYLVVHPIAFYENNLSILLSFSDYYYASPGGFTRGNYTFKLTSNGYAEMTEHTRDLLKINKLLLPFKGGRDLLKVMAKHDYIITKKEKKYHVKKHRKA